MASRRFSTGFHVFDLLDGELDPLAGDQDLKGRTACLLQAAVTLRCQWRSRRMLPSFYDNIDNSDDIHTTTKLSLSGQVSLNVSSDLRTKKRQTSCCVLGPFEKICLLLHDLSAIVLGRWMHNMTNTHSSGQH